MKLQTALTTAILVVSWLLLFYSLFINEKLNKRLTALSVQQEHLIRMVQALVDHHKVNLPVDAFTTSLIDLVRDGKTYEALTAYRTVKGVTYREAKAFIDSLK